ncbi:pupal cuticle protein isoform X1 [Bactrocera neohumeralis]|uniref:pupal cuticle protein isoform X1 n=1 Tax=Bactrocera tryoni TaxID=59916 RepID=UPI001A976865|nr:pupal cuticle protein isoform X1 [Bactrocera tryoni]XP_050320075.1 pupal cuticle protein isoform X1 [Bactrocera neohumeralis]
MPFPELLDRNLLKKLILLVLLISACSATLHGAVSTQFQHIDPHSRTYSYGYADPNSQKHETRSYDGVTRGSYSYVDGNGHVQSLSYVADPHHGFNAVGTNLPKASPSPDTHFAAIHSAAAQSYVPYAHHYPQHIPILTDGGVPVDTPEVQHARAEHYAAYAAAAAAAAAHPEPYDGHSHHLYKRSLYSHPWNYAHQNSITHVPLTHGGVPVDTPDVQAAKAEHFAAHAKVLGRGTQVNGAPSDTPEVAHAKAAHYAAHAAARTGYPIGQTVPVHGYHIPVIHNGVPVETPEVQHAKAAHYAAVIKATSRAGHGEPSDNGGHYGGHWNDPHNSGYTGYKHRGPIHIPVIHNGVPVEPPEVQHARAAHLNALASASHGSGHVGYYEHDDQYHGQNY